MNKWLSVDEHYLQFLRTIDSRIPLSNYGSDKFKPFFGMLFETDDFYYVTQISSAKNRHYNMNNQKDFKKIFINGKLVSVVNLNYMFPIPKKCIEPPYEIVAYGKIDKYRLFKDENEKHQYIALLRKELRVINALDLKTASQELYILKYEKPNDTISKRCLDFKKIELRAKQWENIVNKTNAQTTKTP